MSEKAFDFNKFIEETKAVLLAPADYFASMTKTGGFPEPLIKAVIYGAVAGIINLIWAVLGTSAVGGMFGGMLGGGVGVFGLVMSVIGSIIVLFLGGAILLVISAICGGTTDYESNVRATASLMALSPVSALFGFLTGINFTLGTIVGAAISLYGVWMLYNALVKGLECKDGAAKVISIIIAVIPVLMLLSMLMCGRAAKNFSDKVMDGDGVKSISEEVQKQMGGDAKQLENVMNKALEEAEKQSKEE
jgi:hypothetical protein